MKIIAIIGDTLNPLITTIHNPLLEPVEIDSLSQVVIAPSSLKLDDGELLSSLLYHSPTSFPLNNTSNNDNPLFRKVSTQFSSEISCEDADIIASLQQGCCPSDKSGGIAAIGHNPLLEKAQIVADGMGDDDDLIESLSLSLAPNHRSFKKGKRRRSHGSNSEDDYRASEDEIYMGGYMTEDERTDEITWTEAGKSFEL